MPKAKKGPVQKLRLFDGDLEIAREIAKKTKLDVVTILSLSCSAGLQAIRANSYNFQMPMKFEILEPQNSVVVPNESPPAKRKAGCRGM